MATSESIYTNGEYINNTPTWHVEDSPWKAKQILKIINKNGLCPQTICEVGCGAGEILNQLNIIMPSSTSFYGYEISPQAYNLCKTRGKDNIKFYNRNLLNEIVNFDLLLIIDVIEHIEDCWSFMRNIKTKADYKIFNIPLELWIKALFPNQLLISRRSVGHLHYFNKELALEILRETGYEIIDYELTPGYQLPNRYYLGGRLLKLPRSILYNISKEFTARTVGGCSLIVLAK